jgi:ubiquinone/menaquinone biosynthesis C-methylase UbiE
MMKEMNIQHGRTVRGMFARISRHYDLLNRVMTFGQDGQWRRETVRIAVGEHARWILDIGAGTGDLALEAVRQCPRSNVVAVDFTSEMLILGREKGGGDQIMWIVADGQNLPFKNDVFDSSVSAFLVRNLHLVEPVLIELCCASVRKITGKGSSCIPVSKRYNKAFLDLEGIRTKDDRSWLHRGRIPKEDVRHHRNSFGEKAG